MKWITTEKPNMCARLEGVKGDVSTKRDDVSGKKVKARKWKVGGPKVAITTEPCQDPARHDIPSTPHIQPVENISFNVREVRLLFLFCLPPYPIHHTHTPLIRISPTHTCSSHSNLPEKSTTHSMRTRKTVETPSFKSRISHPEAFNRIKKRYPTLLRFYASSTFPPRVRPASFRLPASQLMITDHLGRQTDRPLPHPLPPYNYRIFMTSL